MRHIFIIMVALLSYHAQAFKVAVISDLNGGLGSVDYNAYVSRAVNKIIEDQIDLVLVTGDMVAGMGAGLDYKAMWKGFHAAVTDKFKDAGIPMMVSPGNHDASAYAAYSGERAIYAEQFSFADAPNVNFVDSSNYPFYYSFEFGGNLFISLDATLVSKLPKNQKIWLNHQLAFRDNYNDVVVFSHLGNFPFVEERGKGNEAMFDLDLESILINHNVKYYFSGHQHAFYPGVRNGINYIGQGCLGSGRRKLIGEETKRRESYTVVEFGNEFKLKALKAPYFKDKTVNSKEYKGSVDLQSLPKSIEYNGYKMFRYSGAEL